MNKTKLILILLALPVMGFAQEYQATLQWSQRAELGSVVSGIIKNVLVNPGDRVKKNAKLIQLDASVYSAAVVQHKALFESAQEQYKEAERERDRTQEMYDRTLLSEHQLQVAKNNFVTAKGELEKARALLVSKRFDLKYSTIRAPFNTIILKRNVQPGEVITTQFAQKPVLVIAASDRMLARFLVPESELDDLKKGMKAKVTVGSENFDGRILAIGLEPSGTKPEGGYPVDVEFKTGQQVLRAGLSAKVNF